MIDTLVISGGGIGGGIAIAGSLDYLRQNDLLKDVRRYCCTSIGAMISSLLIIGYTVDEIYNIFVNDLKSFIDLKIYKIPLNIYRNYGLFSNDKVIDTISTYYEKKGFSKDITLKELYDKTNKIITICGTNLNKQDVYYFNYSTFPDMKVLDAVRITITIPFFYKCVKYNINNKENIFVDGGLLNNFPLYYYDICDSSDKYFTTYSETMDTYINMCKDETYYKLLSQHKKSGTIGITIKTQELDNNGFFTGFLKISNIINFTSSIIQTYLTKITSINFINQLTGGNNLKKYIISIYIKNQTSLLNFFLSKQEISTLYKNGQDTAKDVANTIMCDLYNEKETKNETKSETESQINMYDNLVQDCNII